MARTAAGLFLDLDGTLADSLPIMRTAYDRFLDHFGGTGSDAEFASLIGPPLKQVVSTLAVTHQLSPPTEELLATYWDVVSAAYQDVVPNPGAGDLLETARRLGLRTGLVTSSSVDLALDWLRRVALLEMVDTVVGGDETSRGKPDPQPYLLALKRTECKADQSLAVEDSLSGVRAAMASGIRTFLLSDAQYRVPSGVVVVPTLDDVRRFILENYPGQAGER